MSQRENFLTPDEEFFESLANAPKAEKIAALLAHEVKKERERQRSQDEELDHPIALFTRQKKRSTKVILVTLFLLTVIHGIQLVALYNYNALSGYILTDTINDYVERQYWVSNNASLQALTLTNPAELHYRLREIFGGSERPVIGSLEDFGFCMSNDGYLYGIFNIVVGLFFIYLFIFADLWRVIFSTIITRSFPSDPHFKLVLFGAFWLVCLNAAILTWLGVESGFSVIASHGDFYSVLFNSLNIFIILKLDETVLPLIRFFVEDYGHLDQHGNMSDERLKVLTHGVQYHKPGYGQRWVKNMTTGHPLLRVVAVLNVFVTSAIIAAPLGVTINYAIITFKAC